MIEKVNARKAAELFKDIARTLEIFINKHPDQDIEINIQDSCGTNTIEIEIVDQGYKMRRPINFYD